MQSWSSQDGGLLGNEALSPRVLTLVKHRPETLEIICFCLRTSLHSHHLTTLPKLVFFGYNDSNDSWHPTGLAHKSLLPTRLRRLITGVTSCPNRAVCLNLFEITSASMLPISSANNVMSCPLV